MLLPLTQSTELCVMQNLKVYIDRTKPLRADHAQLLFSFQKPYMPLSTDTIARWLKTVLRAAEISDGCSVHSTRAASASAAERKRLPTEAIMKCAGWSKANTFARLYDT